MPVNSDQKHDRKTRPPKADKRLAKKQNRVKHVLYDQGVDISELPTKILCIYNAGLDNGVTKEQILSLVQMCGHITEIVMIPQRPYSFVVFSDMAEAEKCQAVLNGVRISAEDSGAAVNAMLHPVFVNHAPCEQTRFQPLPLGLILREDFVSEDYEAALLATIDFNDVSPGAQKDLKQRRVKHYGYEFLYGVNNVNPHQPLPQGIPKECERLISEALSAGFIAHRPDQLTVNQYSPGQGIPPHVDTPSAFEDGLMSVSLGSQVIMEFQHPDGRHVSVLLPRRSLLVMTGESRYVWSHAITPRKSDIVTSPAGGLTLATRGTRTSLTFRKIIHNQNPPVQINAPGTEKSRNEKKSPVSEQEAAILETTHVHKVYEEIATHFSDTRHTAWPRIAEFIKSLPVGSLLADIGCGNGKYLGLNKQIYEVCSDRSENLASICAGRGHQIFVGDILSVPLRSGIFDVCICIAVIHHLSTQTRRLNAVRELVRLLAPRGQLLLYVWAMEQERGKVKSNYLKVKKRQKAPVGKEKEKGRGRIGMESVSTSCGEVSGKYRLADTIQEGATVPVIDAYGTGTSVSIRSPTQTSLLPSSSPETWVTSFDVNSFAVTSAKDTSSLKADSKPDGSAMLKPADSLPSDSSPSDAALSNCTQPTVNTDTLSSQPSNKVGSRCTAMTITTTTTTTASANIEPDLQTSAETKTVTEDTGPLSNHLSVHVNRTAFKEQDVLVPWQLKNKKANVSEDITQTSEIDSCMTFHRYYHVFRQGELDSLCETLPNIVIKESYYDQGNWCVLLEKLSH
ncbi:alkylated DNA repair protein alkB homolog 8-like [Liolophura sinensis]|uniref:alkylated DNA repair protein alkB homolog 8-like n=1 Tax=Liolophura sinensis TaxID=3198878 RepID=UPI0031584592